MLSKIITNKFHTPPWPTKAGLIFFFCFLAVLGNNFQEYSNTYAASKTGTFGADFEHHTDSIVPTLKSYRFFSNNRKDNDDDSTFIDVSDFEAKLAVIVSPPAWGLRLNFIPPAQGGYGLTYTPRAPPISLL